MYISVQGIAPILQTFILILNSAILHTTRRGSNFFAEASLSVRGSLGEVAVGFTFAPSVDESEESNNGKDYRVLNINILSKPSERSERGLGIRNEKNEWGGNAHVRGGG